MESEAVKRRPDRGVQNSTLVSLPEHGDLAEQGIAWVDATNPGDKTAKRCHVSVQPGHVVGVRHQLLRE